MNAQGDLGWHTDTDFHTDLADIRELNELFSEELLTSFANDGEPSDPHFLENGNEQDTNALHEQFANWSDVWDIGSIEGNVSDLPIPADPVSDLDQRRTGRVEDIDPFQATAPIDHGQAPCGRDGEAEWDRLDYRCANAIPFTLPASPDPAPIAHRPRKRALIDHEHTGKSGKRAAPSKKQPRIPPRARRVLEDAFLGNAYPSREEIAELAALTNQEIKPIKNWFSNARTRKPAPGEESVKHLSLLPNLSQESLERLEKETYYGQQAPIDAYLSSSSDKVTAKVSGLIETPKQASEVPAGNKFGTPGRSRPTYQSIAPPSLVSSISSGTYFGSPNSTDSVVGGSRRRGRKRWPSMTSPTPGVDSNDTRKQNGRFYCTFCWKGFRDKSDWKRHEATVHVPQGKWICCPVVESDIVECPFCDCSKPDAIHLRNHRYSACASKPPDQRTFNRKDQLIQHIENVHVTLPSGPERSNLKKRLCKLAEIWHHGGGIPSLNIGSEALHCGFCGQHFALWEDRAAHVALHFDTSGLGDRHYSASWWPQRREPLRAPSALGPRKFPRNCPTCQVKLSTADQEVQHQRPVWSCRYLLNFSLLEETDSKKCRLNETCINHHRHRGNLADHLAHGEYHHYRGCEQLVFTSLEQLDLHLAEYHGAWPGKGMQSSLNTHFRGLACPRDPVFGLPVLGRILPGPQPRDGG